jgi:hypothetical protein
MSYDVILLCPINRNFFLKNDTFREIMWFNIIFFRKQLSFKKSAILNLDFNIFVILRCKLTSRKW